MYNYVRFSEGLNKQFLVERDKIYDYVTNENKDYYTSVFLYNKEHYENFKKTGSVAGIKNVVGDQLLFDFDSKEDLSLAKNDASVLVDRLLKDGFSEESIEVAFSGGKGFHIAVHLDTTLTPNDIKKLAFYYASDLKTFDKVVYDPNRLIRLTFTKNLKSGLFKIPITIGELKRSEIEYIKQKAKNLDWCKPVSYKKTKLPNKVLKELEKTEEEKIEKIETISESLDLTKKPKWLTPARFALQEGFFYEGERNTALMILAATYKYQGFDKEIAYRMLKGVAEIQAIRTNAERFPEKEIWNNIINVVYSDNWKGGVFSEDHPLLVTVSERLNLPKVKSDIINTIQPLTSFVSSFKEFATNIDKNTVKLGIPEIDEEVRLTTSMLIGLLAAPSTGKTSIAFNILNNISKNDIVGAFFSMDMGAPLVFQRLIQKHTGLTDKEIFLAYKNKDENKIKYFESILEENYANILFSFSTSLTVDDIRQQILDTQTRIGKKIKYVCIDYLECIQSPYSDPTAGSSYNAQKLKDLANDLDIAILLLLQPQKHTGDPSCELLSMRNIKGSSTIEQACSVIFTMWRPGFNPKNKERDKYLSIAVVKNRMGGLNTWDFKWNGLTGKIEALDFSDLEDLEMLRKEKQLMDGKDL